MYWFLPASLGVERKCTNTNSRTAVEKFFGRRVMDGGDCCGRRNHLAGGLWCEHTVPLFYRCLSFLRIGISALSAPDRGWRAPWLP